MLAKSWSAATAQKPKVFLHTNDVSFIKFSFLQNWTLLLQFLAKSEHSKIKVVTLHSNWIVAITPCLFDEITIHTNRNKNKKSKNCFDIYERVCWLPITIQFLSFLYIDTRKSCAYRSKILNTFYADDKRWNTFSYCNFKNHEKSFCRKNCVVIFWIVISKLLK